MSTSFSMFPRYGAARLAAVAAGMVFCLSGAASAEAGALEGAMTANVISIDASGAEVAMPAETVAPGGVIEYAMSYRNTSDDTLSAITIDGPIPDDTAYVAGSQSVDRPATFEARAPGVDWSVPPLVREVIAEDGTRRTVEVPADAYTQIRWRVSGALEPGDDVSFIYRVQVDQ